MPPTYHYILSRVNILTICLQCAGNIWLIYLLQAIHGEYTDRFITIVPEVVASGGGPRTAKINTALSTNSGGGGRSNLARQIRCKMSEGDGRYERRNARRIRMGKAIKC